MGKDFKEVSASGGGFREGRFRRRQEKVWGGGGGGGLRTGMNGGIKTPPS